MGTGLEGIAAKDEDESTCCAVFQILKSVVREICMLRSVGVGASIWCPFYPAIKGDHHIFFIEGVKEIINLQPLSDSKAKAYQVKQVRGIILKYKLHAEV